MVVGLSKGIGVGLLRGSWSDNVGAHGNLELPSRLHQLKTHKMKLLRTFEDPLRNTGQIDEQKREILALVQGFRLKFRTVLQIKRKAFRAIAICSPFSVVDGETGTLREFTKMSPKLSLQCWGFCKTSNSGIFSPR